LTLRLILLDLLKTGTIQDRQDRVLTEMGVCFGQAAHDKIATFGAFNQVDIFAGGAQANGWGEFHARESSMNWPDAKNFDFSAGSC
jgi:hypothetical protein